MIGKTLMISAASLCLMPAALSQSYGYYESNHCEHLQDEKALLGGVIGAVAGGVIGVAIANDGDDDHYHRRFYRGYRGYKDYHGYRGYRGYRAYRRHGYYHHNDNGDEVAGAVIGGVLGAAVGSSLAKSGTKCATQRDYGGVPGPTRLPYGPAWETPPSNPPQPVAYPYGEPELYGGEDDIPAPAPTRIPEQPEPIYPRECQTVQRETRLPDGGVIREPLEVCRQPDGRWEFQDEAFGY